MDRVLGLLMIFPNLFLCSWEKGNDMENYVEVLLKDKNNTITSFQKIGFRHDPINAINVARDMCSHLRSKNFNPIVRMVTTTYLKA